MRSNSFISRNITRIASFPRNLRLFFVNKTFGHTHETNPIIRFRWIRLCCVLLEYKHGRVNRIGSLPIKIKTCTGLLSKIGHLAKDVNTIIMLVHCIIYYSWLVIPYILRSSDMFKHSISLIKKLLFFYFSVECAFAVAIFLLFFPFQFVDATLNLLCFHRPKIGQAEHYGTGQNW